jgi:signal transduction histidine kinase
MQAESNFLDEHLDRLIEDLDTDIASFQGAVESIRLLDTNPAPAALNLFEFLIAVRDDYLKIPAGGRIRLIQIDEKLRPERVVVDKNHFNLVFRNLFDNSFRATELRSVKTGRENRSASPMIEEVDIRISVTDQDHVELTYTDNGRGIPTHIKSQLYKESVSDQPGNDHGLGGVIIKKLLSLNNSEITVTKSDEQGTTQRIVIYRSIQR